MQDPNNMNQNPNQDPNNRGDGTGDKNQQPTSLSTEEMMTAISEQLGGAPSAREDAPEMTDTEKTILDNQFRQETRNHLEDMQKQVKGMAPDATDQQAFDFGIAMMKGDVNAAFEAAKNIIKTEAEVDEKNEEQKPLSVEGGAQGSQNSNRTPTGLASVFQNIMQQHPSGSGR